MVESAVMPIREHTRIFVHLSRSCCPPGQSRWASHCTCVTFYHIGHCLFKTTTAPKDVSINENVFLKKALFPMKNMFSQMDHCNDQ